MDTKKPIQIFLTVVLVIITVSLYFFLESSTANTPRINEIRFSAADGVDWIEIYNPTLNNVNLQGLFLSDTLNDLTRFEFKETTVIPAGGHILVYGDRSELEDVLEANFRISEGETIYLVAADGITILDSLTTEIDSPDKPDASIGRYPDGSDQILIMPKPTPKDTNEN